MVRIISQGFSTPRSRHSSGEEMIDKFAAMKPLSALSDDEKRAKTVYSPKSLVIDCNTDTNDSFSGLESEEDNRTLQTDAENNNLNAHQDVTVMKKTRRRERNKVSAQNYRQRRRQQQSAAQKTLDSLEAHHKDLMEKVRQLEAEKHIVEEYLRSCVRIPWCPYHQSNGSPAGPCCATPSIPEDAPMNGPITPCSSSTVSCSGPASPCTSPSPTCSDVTTGATNFQFDAHQQQQQQQQPTQHSQLYAHCAPINMVLRDDNGNVNTNDSSAVCGSNVNNNMPVRMPAVAMVTEQSSAS